MKVLIVDDHALFRAGLRLLLETIRPGLTILEAASLDDATNVAVEQPELLLCLLDLGLRDVAGIDSVIRLRSRFPALPIVVVSAVEDAAVVRGCIEAGATSFIPKSASPDVLIGALRQVLDGAIFLPRHMLAGRLPRPEGPPALSPRQIDVLRCLSHGMPTKLIARELGISEYTVKEYIAALFRALNVRNRTEAVIEASRLRLVLEPSRVGPPAADERLDNLA
jgi:DNA-binding NarL/FixJ family response regulator